MNTISTSFESIVGYSLQSLNLVLPIALGIFAIIFVWIIAVRFFKKIGAVRYSSKDYYTDWEDVEESNDDDDDD